MAKKKKRFKKRRKRSWNEDIEKEYGSDPEIPTIMTADELIDKAFRKASKVMVPDSKPFFSARKTASAKLASVSSTIGAVLDRYVSAFPDFDTLHPFHRDLYMTVIDIGRAKKSLAALQWCRGQVATISKKNASQINRTKSRDFIAQKVTEAYGRISSVIKQVGKNLVYLAKVRKILDKIPKIDVSTPIMVTAGSPNVGKSLLVRKISTGKPEVAPYPFTTKSVSVGHFEFRRIQFQVLDTPGILDRPLSKRNKIELQAVMALRHLSQATVFIFDPTEECGTDMKAQRKLLEEIKREFIKDSKVFVVFNKSDIKDRWQKEAPKDAYIISAKEGDGVKGLKDDVASYLRGKIIDSGRLY